MPAGHPSNARTLRKSIKNSQKRLIFFSFLLFSITDCIISKNRLSLPMYQTTSNTKVKGQFSPKGAIDGIWTVEVIKKSKDQTITSHEIITYTFDDGKLSKWEYQLPMTGTFYKYTSEKRLEYGNTSNSIKLPLWFTTRIDKPKKINITLYHIIQTIMRTTIHILYMNILLYGFLLPLWKIQTIMNLYANIMHEKIQCFNN